LRWASIEAMLVLIERVMMIPVGLVKISKETFRQEHWRLVA